jgi:hypothetical protein
LEKQIAQLSIHFICALVQLGHVGFGIRLPSGWLRDGSAVEEQQNHHTRRGDRREEEKYLSLQCINIILTVTPEAHGGLLD